MFDFSRELYIELFVNFNIGLMIGIVIGIISTRLYYKNPFKKRIINV